MAKSLRGVADAWRRAALVADAARQVIEHASALDQQERESLPISVAWQAVATTWRHAAAEAAAAAASAAAAATGDEDATDADLRGEVNHD